jgi:hypothetical protein
MEYDAEPAGTASFWAHIKCRVYIIVLLLMHFPNHGFPGTMERRIVSIDYAETYILWVLMETSKRSRIDTENV